MHLCILDHIIDIMPLLTVNISVEKYCTSIALSAIKNALILGFLYYYWFSILLLVFYNSRFNAGSYYGMGFYQDRGMSLIESVFL